jgi:uncharacterized protein YxeA
MKRHLLSVMVLVVFALLALASRVNRIHYGAFNYGNRVEDQSDTKNFLVMNDGTKVYGEQIDWQSGFLLKNQIKIDDQKFKIADVRGYQKNQVFFGRLGKTYIKRIVYGKINVYVDFTNVMQTTTDHNGFAHTSSYTRTDQYSQKGENGPMVVMASQSDIEDLVNSCPLAVEMAHKSSHQIRKAIRRDRDYLNEIFDVYNNGCKPLTERN